MLIKIETNYSIFDLKDQTGNSSYTIYKYFIFLFFFFFIFLLMEKNGRRRRRFFQDFFQGIFHFGHVQNDFLKNKMSKKLSVAATIFLRFIITCLFYLLTNEFFWTFFWTCSANCVFARTICANLTPTLKNECPKYFHTYFFKMIKTGNYFAENVQNGFCDDDW